jgi:hypothetical protein
VQGRTSRFQDLRFAARCRRSRLHGPCLPRDSSAGCGTDSLIDVPFLREALEEVFVDTDRFGASQEQVAIREQREMAEQQDAFLGRRFNIDQQIAARDQIKALKRRVDQQVVCAENDTLAHLRNDFVVLVVLCLLKVVCQEFRRHLIANAYGIAAGAGVI